jgi:hypothetical protein
MKHWFELVLLPVVLAVKMGANLEFPKLGARCGLL